MTTNPKFFMQDNEGRIYGYWREDVLKCDVASYFRQNSSYPKILMKDPGKLVTRYSPISMEDLEKMNYQEESIGFVELRTTGREL